ncbi:T9SS type A sorting domain-containing protein [bacterium]|nr:T9SS type A sorting domain-containing protein [bacterium]
MRGGCYVILRRGRDPLRVQQAFHIDRNGNHLWGRGGIHIPIGMERRGFGSRQNHVDRLGFYGTLLDFDESGYRYYCYKISYNGDLLWGEDGRLMWADSTGSQNWWGSDYMVDEYGNQFWVLTFAPYRQRTKVLAWALSAEGELGELLSEIHYPPDLFNLTTPNDGDTLALETAADFTWQRSIDLNEEDEVEYRIWFQSGDDSISYTSLDSTFCVQLDTLFESIEPLTPIIWWVVALSPPDWRECRSRFQLITAPLGISPIEEPTHDFRIHAVTPNPCNAQVKVEFSLKSTGVQITIVDISGRRIRWLNQSNLSPGGHYLGLSISDLPSGIYFLNLNSDGQSQSVKFVVQK